jgi:hypothetical protein
MTAGQEAKKEANRLRQQRFRDRKKAEELGVASEPIFYERSDWSLFIDRATLPQRAGCYPSQIGRVILKELVDNALDAGAGNVTITGDARSCVLSDDGPGIGDVARLFNVARQLVSSKIKRLPTRGMLGNGLRVIMGAVVAFNGSIAVTTRGSRVNLSVEPTTGETVIVDEIPAILSGTHVELLFPEDLFAEEDYQSARNTITLANWGEAYRGPSQPRWYGAASLCRTFRAAPQAATVSDIVADLFDADIDDQRIARTLSEDAVAAGELLSHLDTGRSVKVGFIGEDAFGDRTYHRVTGVANIERAEIPFCVEAWVTCTHAKKGEPTNGVTYPIINRSFALTPLTFSSAGTGLSVWDNSSLHTHTGRAKSGRYQIVLSLITPYVRLMNDGKTPVLRDFEDAIQTAIGRAASKAYSLMTKPPSSMTVKDAAYQVMEKAYLKVSDDGTLPAKARQIMYAARPDILRLTGRNKFGDQYFTQTLLPDYITEHPEETANWDVIYDARGHLTEPHTGRSVPLGTLQVRQYVGERPRLGAAAELNASKMYPTAGPRHRYKNVLFVEKEGFDELFQAVNLAERYDLAIMSTKGMSVTASRAMIDKISPLVDKVFVLHDFDISGFSILGTLGTDSRRYTFANKPNLVELGLRLDDVTNEGLDAEAVEVKDSSREARRDTLEEHGATEEEIEFLCPEDETKDCQRVELNAMTSRQLVDFIEKKLQEHGVDKLVPPEETLVEHARRLTEQVLTRKALDRLAAHIARKAAEAELPDNLAEMVEEYLADDRELSWDEALARLILP